MSHRIEQDRAQILALVRGFRLGELFHGSGALDGDANHAAQGLESGARERWSGDAHGSGGARSQVQGSQRNSALRIDDWLAA